MTRPSPPPTSPGFRLQGAAQPRPSRSLLEGAPFVTVTQKAALLPGAVRADLPRSTIDVAPDDVVEVEFAEGERLWMRGDEFRLRFGGPQARGGDGAVLQVPADLALLPPGMATRGPVAWAVKGLKVLGVDLAGMTAERIASFVDSSRSETEPHKRPGPGLYRCALAKPFALTAANLPAEAGAEPWLVFIHGTGSTTWGSFGELWSKDGEPELVPLRAAYGDRVLAFEHATLTESPLENARDLARLLPARARLHLVTHSRGGLVGELLCRGGVTASPAGGPTRAPFDDEQIAMFRDRGEEGEADLLRELGEALTGRGLRVERFVRVACPALGTTLASGRLDRWLSVMGSLAGNALPGTPLADAFADLGGFVAAVVKERTNPERLPGLEAMMPDSLCIKLANWPELTVEGDLAVIAGDIEPSAWWARLAVWLTDRFYDGDHDLVVNTPSMYGGARRARAVASFHKHAAVNHFTYFKEHASATRLVTALTTPTGAPPGFEPLHPPVVDIARAIATRAVGPRPVVFVLPGIMGSELEVAGERVWMRLLALVRGGLARLGVDAADVRPSAVVARYYGDLVERLARTHKVVVFPYDWRLSPATEADRLAGLVREEFAEARRTSQPVRFLAHSMGGLVVRTMIARHEALWREVCAHPGSRFVMLGTPNGGSHAITELLVGQSATFRKLARVDLRHGPAELLRVIGQFPGVLAMLPRDPQEDYFSLATWHAYQAAAGGWGVPPEAALLAARELRAALDAAPLDPARTLYVAGTSDATLAEMRLVRDPSGGEQVQFLATTRGDGRVTWDSGIPTALAGRTWYMDVEHGDLAAHEPAFDAIEELLEQGTTALLPQTPPVARAVTALFPRPPAEDDRYPDEDDLAATVLGAGPRKRRRRARPERRLGVSVVHGNLAFARWAVAVGHYAGDTITSAERHLDLALRGELSRRLQLRLYPGRLETSAVFINPLLTVDEHASPRGAIVVGLGTVGHLSAAALARSFTRALLEYALESCKRPPGTGDGRPLELGVSALLIGTGAGGIPVDDAVFALLHGLLRANEMLVSTGQPARIADLEFVELWEDRAIQALRALRTLAEQPGLRGTFSMESGLVTGDGGLRRLVYEETTGWWHRLQILGHAVPGEAADGSLRFAALTQRARTEVRLLTTQRALVDQFVRDAVTTTRDDQVVARTLFELLLPNELKENAPDQDNLVLLVDEEAAHYPWELLEDPRGDGGRPWVIDHGLLRQLESLEFRETVQAALDDVALVVGDPVSRFTELPGAQAEAEAVARTLRRRFTTTTSIRETSRQVVSLLFARPYKLLHLAGHGVYDYAPDGAAEAGRFTGMVLGDGVFLTPSEVEQMRQVPELVFINCCFLGRVENVPVPPASRQFHRLAANVATQFIRMGVRAVIAAGWAVDDDAATTFATTFYEEMLRGQPLGQAVRTAREATFDRHPRSNTWGAYQCYGDPDYRLTALEDAGTLGADALVLVSPAQAAQELGNVAARLKTGSASGIEAELRRIETIHEIVTDRRWDTRGLVLAALARAFAEAGRLHEATEYYHKALSAEDGAVTAKDVEQLANLTTRYAIDRWRGGEATPADAITTIQAANAMLGALMQQFGATRERLSIHASGHKRLAWVDAAGRIAALRTMTHSYHRAFEHPPGVPAAERDIDAYALLNWLTGEIVLDWQVAPAPPAPERVPDFAELLARARAALGKDLARRRTFWPDVGLVDADVVEAIAAGRLDDQRVAELAGKYRERRRYATAREFASVVDQLDFLIAMATERQHAIAGALTTLREQVTAAAAP